MNEFDIIRTYFASQPVTRPDVRVGIGDDAALVRAPAGMETAMTTDVLVAGVHFHADADAGAIAHKALAVNLSDLAAMGADPAWFLLNLTLPEAKPDWLAPFAEGLHALARRYRVQLIGGDMSRGPLSVAITAIGFVPQGKALLRSGAGVGDRICVTGELGDAALALACRRGERRLSPAESAAVMERLDRPQARTAEGIMLRELASSAIDISDGLLADLGHVLSASDVGARVVLDAVPISDVYREHLREIGWDYALGGGDDYELCFTIPEARWLEWESLARQMRCKVTTIGEVVRGSGLELRDGAGRPYQIKTAGHQHFT